MNAIYLSRAGQTFGPISETELKAMRSSGEIYGYAYLFESPARGWESIHPMPSAPPTAVGASLASPEVPPPSRQRRAPSTISPARPVEVVMHDFHHLVTGNLSSLTESGCELICEEHEEAGPVFAERSRLVLNLLDPKTGRAMNVAASLSQVARKDGHWSYQLRWDQVPEILL